MTTSHIDPNNDPLIVREHRWFETKTQSDIHSRRLSQGFPKHASPFSTLIAAMGPNWESESCMQAVINMGQHCFDLGFPITYYEEPDRCYEPYDALGTMRNAAYMKAIHEGFEYILYVDNDVSPPVNALEKLLLRGVPVVAPMLRFQSPTDAPIGQADLKEQGKGLKLVGSLLLSFLLVRTTVFLPWATAPFWENAVGASEPYHFQRLAMTGHRPFLDTDIVVDVMQTPHYPLDKRPSEGKQGLEPKAEGRLTWKQAFNEKHLQINKP